MWSLSTKEKEAVLKLEPFKRYTYTLKRIADTEVVYCLRHEDETWALAELEEHTLLSIWPHAYFAQNAADTEWPDCKVTKIPLQEFTDSFLPALESGLLINVFGIDDRTGFVVTKEEFLRDLGEELNNY